MNVRVESDGTRAGTVFRGEDGRPLRLASDAEWLVAETVSEARANRKREGDQRRRRSKAAKASRRKNRR